MDFKIMIAGEIASALDIAFGNAPLSSDEIAGLLELPPDSAMGDTPSRVLSWRVRCARRRR